MCSVATTTAIFVMHHSLSIKVRKIGHNVHSLHLGNQRLNKKIDDMHEDLANEIQATRAGLTDKIIKLRQIVPDEFDVTVGQKKMQVPGLPVGRFAR